MPRSLKQKTAIQKQKVTGNVTKAMTPALTERYTQLMALYADNVEQTINFKYQLGLIFNDVSADPKTYGANASQLLMSALGINSKRDIDRVMLFAKTYSEADVERFNHWHEQSYCGQAGYRCRALNNTNHPSQDEAREGDS